MTSNEFAVVDRMFEDLREVTPAVRLRLGGASVSVRSGDESCARLVEERFGHLVERDPHDSAELSVRLMSGEIPPLSLATGVNRLPNGGVATFEPGRDLVLYRPSVGIDLLKTPSTWGEVEPISYPLGAAISSWAVDTGLFPAHAAAVEFNGRGVLLVGESGMGKSTTSLACALAGAGLLGDDLCLIDPVRRVIHSWYGTVKLLNDSAEALGATEWQRLGVNDAGKAVVAVSQIDQLRLTTTAVLDLVVILRPSDTPATSGSLLSESQAVTALRCTAWPASSVPNGLSAWLRHVSLIARTVPIIELPRDRPPEAMARRVAELLEHHVA